MVSVSLRTSVPSVDAELIGVQELPAGSDVPFEKLGFSAEAGQVLVVPSPNGAPSSVTVYLGLAADSSPEALRRAAAKGVRAVGKATSVAVDFATNDAAHLAAIAEGIVLGSYRFDAFRSEEARAKAVSVETATIVTADARKASAKKAVADGVVVAEATCLARDWVNTPPGDLRPADFAASIKANAVEGVTVAIWDEKKLAKEKCGGILGVGRGSDAPPRLVKLTYDPPKAKTHLALVGKGITFDSGGLSIKPGASMQTMKCDMGGAAAIVAAINAIATLGLPIRVTGFACIAENMPSGSATRPGDVLTMRNGSTVEVHNTDAEGRLVLADGLALAVEAKPDRIIDAATLTGAAMVALGTRTAAILGNDDGFENEVLDSSATAGESMWRLPIAEEMKSVVTSSSIADLRQHNPKPYGGTLFAAAFLREFVGDVTWAHLDIAGPAFNDAVAFDYTPVGGTGAGVRTLVQVARDLA